MKRVLQPVIKKSDIPAAYRNTPLALFLEYHNLGRPFSVHPQASLLIPDNVAFIIRSGGENLRYSDFKVF